MKKVFFSFILLFTFIFFSCLTTNSNIHRMIENKNYESLRSLMFEDNVDINKKNSRGETPLILAVKNNDFRIVKFLIDLGADINLSDNNGDSALFFSSYVSNMDIMKFLIDNGANINHLNKSKDSVLSKCVEKEQVEFMKYLVLKGSNIYSKNNKGIAPLQIALRKGVYFVKYLVDENNINNLSEFGKSPLSYAIEDINSDVVEYLLKTGADVNNGICDGGLTNIEYTFKHCSNIKYADIAIKLIEYGATVPDSKYEYIFYYVKAPKISGFYSQGGFPLHKAIKLSQKGFVEYFIKNKFDINLKDDNGFEPISLSMIAGDNNISKLIIKSNANVNSRTPDGDTPLILVLKNQKNNKEMVKLLLKSGAKINVRNNFGDSPLLVAIRENYDIDIIKTLLDGDGDINLRNNNGETALHLAIEKNRKKIIELLLKKGANINALNNDGVSPYGLVLNKDADFISWIVSKMKASDRDDQGNNLLHTAVKQGADIDTIKLLLLKGVDVNQKNLEGNIPLHLALKQKNEELIKTLIEAGSNLFIENNKKETPIVLALSSQWQDDSWLLSDKFLKAKDFAGNSPLHFAVRYNLIESAKTLIEMGASLNAKNNLGQTPFHISIVYDKKNMAEILIKNGANVSIRDNAGNSAYHYIVLNKSDDMIPILLKEKADMDISNIYGKTALHEAVSYSKNNLVKTLIKNGASVDIRDNWGRVALHDAAKAGNIEAVQMILASGSDIDPRDNAGKTPLYHSVEEQSKNVALYFLSMGADCFAKNKKNVSPIDLALDNKQISSWFVDRSLLNQTDNLGRTPLHLAILEKKPIEVLEEIIKKDPKFNVKDREGKTPLLYSVENKYYEASKILINENADIFARDKDGISTIYYGIDLGPSVLDWMITEDNINKTDNQGNTPLHLAAIKKSKLAYDYLIEKGSDASILNKDGYTAQQLFRLR